MAESVIKSYFPSQVVSDVEKISYDYDNKYSINLDNNKIYRCYKETDKWIPKEIRNDKTHANNNEICSYIDICHKNYLYYIEFISQITDNDNHLSLTPNDAVFFVLKKSIFNIINNETDGYEIENFDKLCPVINELITFHNTILYYYIDLIDMDSHTHFFVFNENIYLITEHILKIHSMNNVKNLISYAMISKIKNQPFDLLTKNLIQFMTYISDTHINNDDIYNIIV